MTKNENQWPPTRERSSGHQSLRVLVVDDEEHLQELLRTELSDRGHEVTVCPSGRVALKVLETSTFDAATRNSSRRRSEVSWASRSWMSTFTTAPATLRAWISATTAAVGSASSRASTLMVRKWRAWTCRNSQVV